jgi:putative endonuclease
MYYVYLLRCFDNSLYCGQTKNLENRIKEHNTNKVKSAKYTWSRRPVKLVYSEEYNSIGEVLRREIEIKNFSKIKKEKLIKQ